MKLMKFRDLRGETDMEKLTTMVNRFGPCCAQIKLNGVHAQWTGRDLYTRQGHCWDLSTFPTAFVRQLCGLQTRPGERLYGELFTSADSFQEMVGALSVTRKDYGHLTNVGYYVFDISSTKIIAAENPWSRRLQRLIELFESQQDLVRLVLTSPPTYNQTILNNCFNEAIAAGNEGVVYRPTRGVHTGTVEQIIKRKRLYHAEGKCVGVYEGKGKRAGMLGGMTLALPTGAHVNVSSGRGVTDKVLAELFADPPIGRLVTFSYEDMSATGIPLRPQFVAVRNYE